MYAGRPLGIVAACLESSKLRPFILSWFAILQCNEQLLERLESATGDFFHEVADSSQITGIIEIV